MQSFLTSESGLWRRVRKLCRTYKDKIYVSVPYLGSGASRILKLSKGSVLVVNASDGAIRAGQTNPFEILKYIENGVNVYSFASLHAKIYLFGETAIIGSNNVSSNSENNLMEAAVETTDNKVVAEAKSFIKRLLIDQITPQHAVNLTKIYKPPRMPGGKKRKAEKRVWKSNDKLCWIVAIYRNYDKDDRAVEKEEEPNAEKLINTEKYRIYSIGTSGKNDPLYKNVKEGQDIIVVDKTGGSRKAMVSPPSKIVHVVHYKVKKQSRVMVFYQRDKGLRSINIQRLSDKLESKDYMLLKTKDTYLVKRNIRNLKMVLLGRKN